MAISSANAAAAAKTRRVETLTSGTSWTVPADVTFVNVTLVGGGQGGTGAWSNNGIDSGSLGTGGSVISSTLTTTPGGSIAYGIGAGGTGGSASGDNRGGSGGSTTFTGATTATGGSGTGGTGNAAANGGAAGGFSGGNAQSGGTGGSGAIYIEYWV
jgi:hypothetical protein